MKCRTKIASFLPLAILTGLSVIAAAILIWPSPINLGTHFTPIPFEIADYDLNDLGIADVNKDKHLDIFTTNHSAQQSLLIGDQSGMFTDIFEEQALSQDKRFPCIEDTNQKPELDAPGIYIYRQNNILNIAAYETTQSGISSGSLDLSSPITFERRDSSAVTVSEDHLSTGGTISHVQFSLQSGEHVAIKAFVEIPHRFQWDDSIPLSTIYIGTRKLNPESHSFELTWRDRHSMAWADFDADGKLDVFVGRGGIKGKMHELPESFYDELFVGQETNFEDKIQKLGMLKDNCPGRQAAWIDYDNDGRLDLYHSCGRSASDDKSYPHQLFHQEASGSFTNVAKSTHLDLPRNGEFLWIDTNQDGDLDLIATQDEKISIYENQDGNFVETPLGKLADSSTKKFTVVDYDHDGSLDVYISGKSQNYLLTVAGNHYKLTDPTEIGLPGQGLCSNWVDYNNDGLSDLYVAPGGLYQQLPNHQFRATQLLSENTEVLGGKSSLILGWNKPKLRDVRCAWFDYDNDGLRDLLLAEERVPSFLERIAARLTKRSRDIEWQTQLFKNRGFNGHWLEIELKGQDSDNTQAIGASIRLVNSNMSQMQPVGSSEGSYFSQGHYRVYFGLGRVRTVDAIQVSWPNGQVQTLKAISADQLITIQQSSGLGAS